VEEIGCSAREQKEKKKKSRGAKRLTD
jgi:hypothetical protein